MFNEKFWLAIAFATFILLLLKLARKAIGKSLDDKSKLIAEEILAAKELKEKAVSLFASAEKFSQESTAFAQKLIKDAEIEAQKFLAEAQKSVEDEVAKKTAAAAERIKQEEALAISQIKEKIVSAAVGEVEAKLQKNLSEQQSNSVLTKAIQDLGQNI